MIRRHALAALFMAASFPALAQTPALKSAVLVRGAIVHLGDLMENAGPAAAAPLFRAPDLGQSGVISASRIVEAARELGLRQEIDTRNLSVVTVRRPARAVSMDEVTQSILGALKRNDARLGDATLRLDAPLPALARDALDSAALEAELLVLDHRLERFEARLPLPNEKGEPVRVSGSFDTRLPVSVLTRDIPRGDTIQAADIRAELRARRDIPSGALIEPTRLTGLVARKALRAGQPVRDGEVVRPDMVERNQLVTVLYESAGMTLSLRGKALSAGAEGAIVPVQNLQSKRTIETIVIGPGRVSARHHAPE